jgi:hypothetical protein
MTLISSQNVLLTLVRFADVIDIATIDIVLRVRSTTNLAATDTVQLAAFSTSVDEDDRASDYVTAAALTGAVSFPTTTSIPIQMPASRLGTPYGRALRIAITGSTTSGTAKLVTVEFSADFIGRASS